MIVESVLNGPPGDYAWIVPLPSPPTKVYEVSPWWFDRDGRRYGPGKARFTPTGLYLCLGLLFLVAAIWSAWNPSQKNAGQLLLSGILGAVVLAVFFPIYAMPSGKGNAIERLQSMTVGDYSVEVVRSNDAKALATWMRKNGGHVPAEAETAVAEYVKEGWCFMVSKLMKSSGKGSAHPLAVTFPSNKAIYPMRLTAAQGNRVTVELMVLSDETATAEPLQIWNSSRFPPSRIVKFDEDYLAISPLSCLAWPGCAVTRLRGDMDPRQMTHDIVVGSTPFKEQRITLGDRQGFDTWALDLNILMVGLGAFLASLICGFIPTSRKIAVGSILLVGIGISGWTSYNVHAGIKPISEEVIQVLR